MRVFPSQVVEAIDAYFPAVKEGKDVGISTGSSLWKAKAIMDLVSEIPNHLLTLVGNDQVAFYLSISHIQSFFEALPRGGNASVPPLIFAEFTGQSPIRVLRQLLVKCPDEAPLPETTTLGFVDDIEFQGEIRSDISAANTSLQNGEWKAATVLAGAVVEALLLWALSKQQEKATQSAKKLVGCNKIRKPKTWKIVDWNLAHLVEVAVDIGVIEPHSAEQSRLAKDFRNLIHPGKGARLSQKCDRATALSAVAAVEHVVRDLSNNSPSK